MVTSITESVVSKKIDNLSYSIRPKDYSSFKKNLMKMLMDKPAPGSHKTYYEIMFNYLKNQLEDFHIKYSPEELEEHTIMVMSLMNHKLTPCNLEYDFKGKYVCKQYLGVMCMTISGNFNQRNIDKSVEQN